jgi:tRNA (mo5U34)-methyltransferase
LPSVNIHWFGINSVRYIKGMGASQIPKPFDYVRDWQQQRLERGWWHSFELPDGRHIEGVCKLPDLRQRIQCFPISQDLRGKRVLDIGAWDGWFSFEMERRGAEVMAIDNWDNPRFHQMRSMLGSRVEYLQIDIYELTPERVGRFDIVLFMGVLYHLKHPLLALERVCALTTEMAAVDSFVLRERHRPGEEVDQRPVMEFYETDEFGGQTDNWVAPTLPCLEAFCRTAGFARVEQRGILENSACLACYRHWETPPVGAPLGPELAGITHNTNDGINFTSWRDELVSAWFRWPEQSLSLDHVKPEVSGYGVRPIFLARGDADLWHINFKLPPGLTPGWHEVRIRVRDSLPGIAKLVAVDVPVVADEITIEGVRDGTTWEDHALNLSRGRALAIWIRGLPSNADRNNLRVMLDGTRVSIADIEPAGSNARQVNVEVPAALPPRAARLTVAIAGIEVSTEIRVIEP